MKSTLGDKIKAFRKRSGMSQLELETEVGMAVGSVSRIESGKINPTKETIHQVSQALKLNQRELADLLEVAPLKPTEKEITSAIEEVREYLEKEGSLAYLVDDWWRLHAVSRSLMQLLGLTSEQMEKARGKNLLEIYYLPEYGVLDTIDPKYRVQNYAIETARAKAELNKEHYGDYFQQITEKIKKSPVFERVWAILDDIEDSVVSAGSRVSYVKVGSQKVKLHHAREKLKKNPRFELVELFNPQPYS